jgi:hypothetical protein
MNFLKKKLKPLTSGLNQSSSTVANPQHQRGAGNRKKDLEDDLYDEYVVEAPPHPSELLALGVEPSEIDVNDPDKLRELYNKAKEDGKHTKANSVLLARQRQKEEIEEKKRTKEEWKFFDSLTSRVEQVVKESQKNLDHWRESSAVSELTEPDYELRQTADEVFKSVTAAKLEKGANEWVDFDDDTNDSKRVSGAKGNNKNSTNNQNNEEDKNADQHLDEFGCPRRKTSSIINENQIIVVKEILEDFGIDLSTAKQREILERKQKESEEKQKQAQAQTVHQETKQSAKVPAREPEAAKVVLRPRPRPRGNNPTKDHTEQSTEPGGTSTTKSQEPDPFDTSFVSPELDQDLLGQATTAEESTSDHPKVDQVEQAKFIDPFDTSYVNL